MKGEESSSKAAKGRKTKESEHLISRCQISHTPFSRCENFAHHCLRCEILGPKEEDFAHSYLKVRNQFQGANFLKSNFAHHCGRCENFRTVRNPLLAHECHFRTPQANFHTVRNSVRKFRTPLFKVRKFRTPNSKVRNGQTKVRKFRTVKF